MLFNILTVVLVYIMFCALGVAAFRLITKKPLKDADNKTILRSAITLTIVFAWLMSWQNWWR